MRPPRRNERRATSHMPYRRRQQGLTAADRRVEVRSWLELNLFLEHLGGIIGNLPLLEAGLNVAYGLLNRVLAMRTVVWGAHARINKVLSGLYYYSCKKLNISKTTKILTTNLFAS